MIIHYYRCRQVRSNHIDIYNQLRSNQYGNASNNLKNILRFHRLLELCANKKLYTFIFSNKFSCQHHFCQTKL